MGNLITSSATVLAPFLATEIFIPYIYNPIRFNNIPFVKPSTLKYMFWYTSFILIYVYIFATIGGTMSSLKECTKMDILTSMWGALTPLLFTLFGIIFLALFPIIKAPLLALFAIFPYSDLLVTGILLSIFTMIGGIFGNNYVRDTVCYS